MGRFSPKTHPYLFVTIESDGYELTNDPSGELDPESSGTSLCFRNPCKKSSYQRKEIIINDCLWPVLPPEEKEKRLALYIDLAADEFILRDSELHEITISELSNVLDSSKSSKITTIKNKIAESNASIDKFCILDEKNCEKITGRKAIADFSLLRHLYNSSQLTDTILAQIDSIEINGIKPEDLPLLKACPNLKCLAINSKDIKCLIEKAKDFFTQISSLDLKDSDITAEEINSILENCPNLQSFNLSYSTNTLFDKLSATAKNNLQHIAHINMNCKLAATDIKYIIENCPNLQSLNLRSYYPRHFDPITDLSEVAQKNLQHIIKFTSKNTATFDVIKKNIIENCPDLQSLSIQGFENTSAENLNCILENGNNLQSLDLSSCQDIASAFTNLSDTAKKNLHQITALNLSHTQVAVADVKSILENGNNLQSLDLSSCQNIASAFTNLSDMAKRNLQHVTSLYLRVTNVSAADFISILENRHNLQSLDLSSCQNIASAFTNLSNTAKKNLQHITALDLSYTNVTAADVKCILGNCQNLQSLNLRACEHIVSAFTNFSDTAKKNLQNITSLNLSCTDITAADVKCILENCQNLQSLNLSSCQNIASAFTNLLNPAKKNLQHVTSLDLSSTKATAEDVKSILENCQNLQSLNLGACEIASAFTNLSYTAKNNLQHITSLNLYSTNITAEDVKNIFEYCPNLQSLALHGCSKTTSAFSGLSNNAKQNLQQIPQLSLPENMNAEDIKSILENRPNLTTLDLSGCPNIAFAFTTLSGPAEKNLQNVTSLNLNQTDVTAADIKSILGNCPKLRSLDLSRCENIASAFTDLSNTAKNNLQRIIALGHTSLNLKETKITQEDEKILLGYLPIAQLWNINRSASKPGFNTNPSLPPSSNVTKTYTQTTTYQPAKSGIDGDTKFNSNISFQLTEYFRAKTGNNPVVNYYREEVVSDFVPDVGGSVSFESCSHNCVSKTGKNVSVPNLSTQELQKTFDSSNLCYGEFTLNNTTQWQVFPSLSAYEQLKFISVENNFFELRRCEKHDLYYFRFQQVPANTTVRVLLDVPTEISEQIPALDDEGKQFIQSIKDTLTKIKSYQDLYKNFVAIQKKVAKNKEKYTKILVAHFNSMGLDNEGLVGLSNNPTAIEILAQTFLQNKGACRHRTNCFMFLAKLLGIEARKISNQIHSFVEVNMSKELESKHWVRFDLGGYPANIKITPLPTSKPTASPKPMPLPLPQKSTTSQKPKPFTMRDLVNEKSKNILTIIPSAKTEDFKCMLIQSTHRYFFINHPDDFKRLLWCKVITKDGKTATVPGPLQIFLKNASKDDSLVIDWTSFKGSNHRIAGCKSILDDKRTISKLEVSGNCRIISLLGNEQKGGLSEDFYSRHQKAFDISAADIPSIGALLPPEAGRASSSNDTEVNLYGDGKHFEQDLIGYLVMKDGRYEFIEGALLQALKNGSSTLNLKNAPWQNQRFKMFIRTLLHDKRFFANGQYHQLPGNFKITRSSEPYQFDRSNYLASNTNNQIDYVLNRTTLHHFIRSHKVNANSEMVPIPGWLEQNKDKTINILVTKDLKPFEWQRLTDVARMNNCSIKLTFANNKPKDFSKLAEDLPNLKSCIINTTNINATTQDILSKIPKVDLVVTVTADMTFTDLVQRVVSDKQNNKFRLIYSDIWQARREGKTVLLTGSISKSMMQNLTSPFLWANNEKEDPTGKLIIVTDSKIPEGIGFQYQDQRALAATAEPKITVEECNSKITADDFENGRKKLLLAKLDQNPCIAVEGSSNAGKTTSIIEYVNKTYGEENLFIGKHQLADWAKKPPSNSNQKVTLLINDIDFADSKNTAIFTGLFNPVTPGLLIDGKFYPVDRNHKIVFEINNQVLPDFIKEHPETRILLADMPEVFIREKILKPILLSTLSDTTADKIIDIFMEAYHYVNDELLKDKKPLTVHSLKNMAQQFVNLNPGIIACYSVVNDEVANYLDDKQKKTFQSWLDSKQPFLLDLLTNLEKRKDILPKKNQTTVDFIFTDIHKPLLKTINSLLATHGQVLVNQGILIQGASGIGKSTVVQKYLELIGFVDGFKSASAANKYYQITASDPESMRKTLIDAYYEGATKTSSSSTRVVVIIDELNIMPEIFGLLKSLIEGTYSDPKRGEKPKHGLSVVATQNPLTFSGRSPLPQDLKNLFTPIEMPEYSAEACENILSQLYPKIPKKELEKLVATWREERLLAVQNDSPLMPTFRELKSQAKLLSETQTPCSTQTQNSSEPNDTKTLTSVSFVANIGKNTAPPPTAAQVVQVVGASTSSPSNH